MSWNCCVSNIELGKNGILWDCHVRNIDLDARWSVIKLLCEEYRSGDKIGYYGIVV